jgi:hypothetical protein
VIFVNNAQFTPQISNSLKLTGAPPETITAKTTLSCLQYLPRFRPILPGKRKKSVFLCPSFDDIGSD